VGGRGEAAIALADEHLQEPARGALLDRLAALLVHQDELDRARRALLRALRRPGPATVSRLRALGVLEMARGAPEDALPWLERALRRSAEGPVVDSETSVGLHLDLAGALLAAGQRSRAVAVLRTARARHPTDPEPALALARGLLEAGGDPAGGARAAEAARALGAGPVETGLLLGRGYLDAGDLRRARAAFQEVLEHAPGHPRAEAGLAAVRQAEGEGRR
jgi:tetratricopeptide (TPR) repeat protein